MNKPGNGADEVQLTFKIADLALMTASLQTAVAEAMLRQSGKGPKERLIQIEQQFLDLIPVGKLAIDAAYSWYKGFSALSECKSFHVFLDQLPVNSYDHRESCQFALIVDGGRYNLSSRFEPGKFGSPEKAALPEMLERLEEIVVRSADVSAEPATSCVFPFKIPELKPGFKTSRFEDIRQHLSKEICERLKLDEADFYLRDFEGRYWPDSAVIVGHSDRIASIVDAYGLQDTPTPALR